MQKETLSNNVIISNNKLISTELVNNNNSSANIITIGRNNNSILKNKNVINSTNSINNNIIKKVVQNNNVIKNNHNNKYDPNTIYTSTQYLIDTDPILIQDEKKVMQLSKDLCNPNSQSSIVFNFSIKQSINNILNNNRKAIFMDEFRHIIDTLIKCNIGELPERAEEVKKLNIVLTKVTLNNLLNRVIANNINITEHNILLLNDNNYNITSILGNQFNNDIKDLDNINYKNKQCSFKIKQDCNALYYTVVLR